MNTNPKKTWIAAGLVCGFFCIPGFFQAASVALHVVGNKIETVGGNCPVRLKGVNVASMEFSIGGEGPAGGIVATVTKAITEWKCNIVRIPMNQDYWFGYQGANQANYRAIIDNIVAACSSNNAYADLDLHWSGTGFWGTATTQQDMPDNNSTAYWSDVATRYANNPAVLFGLYNEPHDISWDVWRNGGAANGFNTPGLQPLLNTVRATGALNVVVAGGMEWAYDLRQLPAYHLVDSTGNGVIYDSHVYPWKNNPWAPANGDQMVSVMAGSYAIMIGEFGQDQDDTWHCGNCGGGAWPTGIFTNSVLGWIDAHNYSACAWDMHPGACPCTIFDRNFNKTAWQGVPVANWLAATGGGGCPFSPTPTPVRSATATASFTKTPTPKSTTTYTPTASPSPTFSSTGTKTASPSATATSTPTASPSSTLTAKASSTPTQTAIGTFTDTPTSTQSNTFTATPTCTSSATASASSTATSSSTATPTVRPSLTTSPTPSISPTLTASPSQTIFIPPTCTGTPLAVGAGNGILDLAVVPNPQMGPVFRLDVKLAAFMDNLTIHVYDKALTLVFKTQLKGSFQPGWNLIHINLPGLSNATYYVRASGKQGGCPTVASKTGKLCVMR